MRKYRHIWVPAVLGIYFLFMTFYFGTELLKTGETLRFWGTVGAETAILTALVFFMRKREKLRREREEDIRKNSNQE